MSRAVALPTITDDSALGGAVIERSLRFNRDDGDHLTYTPASASSDRTKITISAWVKKCGISQEQNIFHAGTTNNDRATLRFYHSGGLDCLSFFAKVSGSFILYVDTSAKFRDITGWYHIVARCDTTNGTANIYVNGEEITNLATNTKPSGSQSLPWFNNIEHQIGERGYSPSGTYMNGYMAEINVIQGQALDASYFGYTEFQTGIWRPKRYTGSYGDGFYLNFSTLGETATTMGLDRSGNNNNFTPVNLEISDFSLDTPSNTFATLNPLSTSVNTLSNGNLYSTGGGASWRPVSSDMAMSSGRWYWEIYIDTVSSYQMHGIRPQIRNDADTNHDNDYYPGTREDEWGYNTDGRLHNDASATSSWGDTYTAGDIIGVALDMDAGTLNFYKNGSATGSQITGVSAVKSPDGSRGDYLACCCVYGSTGQAIINFGQDGTFAGHKSSQNNTDINGIGNFFYTPPTGFKALCTANLRGDSSYVINSQKHFGVVTYTGNGSTGQSITSLNFQPDLIWFKARNNSRSHAWNDSVRGRSKVHYCNLTNAEDTDGSTQGLISFNPDGFTVGADYNAASHNRSGDTIVAWCWKAGGNSNTYNIDGTGYGTASAAGLDGGTITPTGSSVNTKAGFSITTYTGNGTAGATVAHGLGNKPVWVVIKRRDSADNWMVYHQGNNNFSNPHHYYVELNANGADINSTIMMNDTAPTSSLFSLGSDPSVNVNSGTYVAYSWAEIPGYSKFGTYKGNGSTSNGSYIHLGFRPALIIMKKFSGSDSWEMHDSTRTSYNNMKAALFPSSTNTESTSSGLIDFLSNGFKHYNANGNTNEDGSIYFYIAFAERVGETPYATFPNAR